MWVVHVRSPSQSGLHPTIMMYVNNSIVNFSFFNSLGPSPWPSFITP